MLSRHRWAFLSLLVMCNLDASKIGLASMIPSAFFSLAMRMNFDH